MGLVFDRVAVHSSNVRSVGWIPTKIMEVEFTNGSVYRYYNVPQEVFEGMLASGSVGKYLHRVIKPNYIFKRQR